MFEGRQQIESVLNALSEQLEAEGAGRIEIVVCGGSALNILGYVRRPTEDVDVVAVIERDSSGAPVPVRPDPLNPRLMTAAEKVQKDFNLPDHWLNDKCSSLTSLGLPECLMDRVETREYGKNLIIHFLGRYDQIHFKLNAVVWIAPERHYDDLIALKPTDQEIEDAARWCMTLYPKEGFRTYLQDVL